MKRARWAPTAAAVAALTLAAVAFAPLAHAAAPPLTLTLSGAGVKGTLSTTLAIILGITLLSIAPAILILMTSFTRIVVVLSFVRSALGTQSIPPNQVIVGLALFLTFVVMAPTIHTITTQAVVPYQSGTLSEPQALKAAIVPVRAFMMRQTDAKDIETMMGLAKLKQPKTSADIPTYVLIPAFVLHELKVAFEMAFLIYLPFLLIDLVVASTLMSLGMLMLPPMLVSLPFKILLFVLVGGWGLVVQSVVTSFH